MTDLTGRDTSGGYGDEACERLVPEPAKRPGRTPFERDRARVLHSAALRRLSAKTQVVGPGTDDFVRNRLTHTLEVAQVARELGQSLGCNPDIVDSAALAHDLGHPPFGHNGERELDAIAAPCGGFEGNAQTLRVLTRLESKAFDAYGDSVGLNLTRATLDACTKYPWQRAGAKTPSGSHTDGSPRGVHKFGVYTDDMPVFTWLRAGAPATRRCIEAQVMDLADDIAYSVHDVEDGVVGGRFDLERVTPDRAEVWEVAHDWYASDATDDDLDAAFERLCAMPQWPMQLFDGRRQARAQLKSLTSALIGRFVMSARAATRDGYGEGALTRHRAHLVVPAGTAAEIVILKSIAAHYVMRADDRIPHLDEQRQIVRTLVEGLLDAPPDALEPEFREDFDTADDDPSRLRVVIDQVASLTDVSARAWARRLA